MAITLNQAINDMSIIESEELSNWLVDVYRISCTLHPAAYANEERILSIVNGPKSDIARLLPNSECKFSAVLEQIDSPTKSRGLTFVNGSYIPINDSITKGFVIFHGANTSIYRVVFVHQSGDILIDNEMHGISKVGDRRNSYRRFISGMVHSNRIKAQVNRLEVLNRKVPDRVDDRVYTLSMSVPNVGDFTVYQNIGPLDFGGAAGVTVETSNDDNVMVTPSDEVQVRYGAITKPVEPPTPRDRVDTVIEMLSEITTTLKQDSLRISKIEAELSEMFASIADESVEPDDIDTAVSTDEELYIKHFATGLPTDDSNDYTPVNIQAPLDVPGNRNSTHLIPPPLKVRLSSFVEQFKALKEERDSLGARWNAINDVICQMPLEVFDKK